MACATVWMVAQVIFLTLSASNLKVIWNHTLQLVSDVAR